MLEAVCRLKLKRLTVLKKTEGKVTEEGRNNMAAQYLQIVTVSRPLGSTADELRQIGELEALEADRDCSGLLLHGTRTGHSLRLRPKVRRDLTALSLQTATVLQHQTALGTAHIVPQDHVTRPLAGQLGAVCDPQRGALRTLVCTNAAGAGRRERRIAHIDLLAADVAALDHVLPPRAEIDLLHCVAWHSRIEEVTR